MDATGLTDGPEPGQDERNLVLDSIENPVGDRCVDIFQRPDGTFGFEEWRRDPEDASGWYRVGGYGGHVFTDIQKAIALAHTRVQWSAAVVEGS